MERRAGENGQGRWLRYPTCFLLFWGGLGEKKRNIYSLYKEMFLMFCT